MTVVVAEICFGPSGACQVLEEGIGAVNNLDPPSVHFLSMEWADAQVEGLNALPPFCMLRPTASGLGPLPLCTWALNEFTRCRGCSGTRPLVRGRGDPQDNATCQL